MERKRSIMSNGGNKRSIEFNFSKLETFYIGSLPVEFFSYIGRTPGSSTMELLTSQELNNLVSLPLQFGGFIDGQSAFLKFSLSNVEETSIGLKYTIKDVIDTRLLSTDSLTGFVWSWLNPPTEFFQLDFDFPSRDIFSMGYNEFYSEGVFTAGINNGDWYCYSGENTVYHRGNKWTSSTSGNLNQYWPVVMQMHESSQNPYTVKTLLFSVNLNFTEDL